jgi:hypothetical protein
MSEGETAKDDDDGLHDDDGMDEEDVDGEHDDGEHDDGGDKDGDSFDAIAVFACLAPGFLHALALGIGGDDDASESHSVRSPRLVGLAVIGRLIFLDRALAEWCGLCETATVPAVPAPSPGTALK